MQIVLEDVYSKRLFWIFGNYIYKIRWFDSKTIMYENPRLSFQCIWLFLVVIERDCLLH